MIEKRILLLANANSYRGQAFAAAAEKLKIDVVQMVDMPQILAAQSAHQLALDLNEPETAVAAILQYAATQPLSAIFPVDDNGILVAAQAAEALNLPHNLPAAAAAARDKLKMRQLLVAGGVPVPAFRSFALADAFPTVVGAVMADIGFPCVVKPRTLNGSRGVIRANDPQQLAAVLRRVGDMLRAEGLTSYLIEEYLPGVEVALEGVLDRGRLQVLALFDKPDPLEGPYFEETIYVTPSRLSAQMQADIAAMTVRGAAALGLQTGPVHAELRLNEAGPWIVEVNGRSIGGLCGQTLRFDMALSLEELLLRQACGLDVSELQREQQASGVMMIPIPQRGLLRGYTGVDEALQVPGIDDVTITAPLHNRLVPLPEGESYLGFIFASAESPQEVEAALRQAHGRLHFVIQEEIPLRLG